MSITLHNYPQSIEPIYSDAWFRVSSSNVNKPNFRFVFDTYTVALTGATNETKVNRSKLFPRPDSYCLYSPSRVLENYLSYDFDVFCVGFRGSMNSVMGYKLKFGEEWDITGNTLTFSSITNNSGFAQFDFTYPHSMLAGDTIKIECDDMYINPTYSTLQTITSIVNTYSFVTNIPIVNTGSTETGICTYRLTMDTGVSFSGVGINFARQYNQRLTDIPATYNIGYNIGRPLTDSAHAEQITVTMDDHYILSWVANAGMYPTYMLLITQGTGNGNGIYKLACPLSATPEVIRFDFGAGPANLANVTGDNLLTGDSGLVLNSNVTNYSLVPAFDSGGTVVQFGQNRQFKIVENCASNRTRIAFLNTKGGVDIFNFTGFQRKIDIQKENYVMNLDWNYDIGDRGETIANVSSNSTITIYTDWLTVAQSTLIERLLTSAEAYLVVDSAHQLHPIIITTNEFTTKSTEDGELIMYSISYRFAYNTTFQRN